MEILEGLRAGKQVDRRETVRMAKDGQRIEVLVTASPLRSQAGQIIGASRITRDITERRRAEESLRRTVEELERSNKELEQFAYVTSHDLQEPLRQVRAFVQLLRERYGDRFDGKAGQYMQFIYNGAERMSNLVADLLEYSRVGSRERKRDPVLCQPSLDAALRNLAASIEEAGARITCDLLPTVTADPTLLTQLFQNLIGNAVKFRWEDVQPAIHVGARREDDHWLFWVRDNGIGVPPEHAERIFQIFQRLHTRDKYPGTGIGLAISKKIVERHGGRIWVESQPGRGSTFYFTLPEDRAL
jgi:light-regulated signal transduction histidine kinase (bacteriophytochrome)